MRSAHPWMLPSQPVTRALLLASGITRAMIATQVRSGRLMLIRHGVYLSADAWPEVGAARHIVMGHAEQVANPGAVLSHQSAAVAWGLSAAESRSAGHFLLADLPVPQYQPLVSSPMGRLFPDFLWPAQRVVGEVDGAVKYDDRNAFVLEKQREQVLRDLGFVVVRWLAREIMLTPWVVVERVARALSV